MTFEKPVHYESDGYVKCNPELKLCVRMGLPVVCAFYTEICAGEMISSLPLCTTITAYEIRNPVFTNLWGGALELNSCWIISIVMCYKISKMVT